MISTVDDAIEALGGTGVVAASLGLNPSVVSSWRSRGSIPADRWQTIVNLARDAECPGLTLEALARMHAKPAEAAAAEARS